MKPTIDTMRLRFPLIVDREDVEEKALVLTAPLRQQYRTGTQHQQNSAHSPSVGRGANHDSERSTFSTPRNWKKCSFRACKVAMSMDPEKEQESITYGLASN